MAIISSSESKMRTEETQYRASVSEAMLQKIGANINALIDDNDTQDTAISTNASNISTNASNISTNASNISTNATNITNLTNSTTASLNALGDVSTGYDYSGGSTADYTIPTNYMGWIVSSSITSGGTTEGTITVYYAGGSETETETFTTTSGITNPAFRGLYPEGTRIRFVTPFTQVTLKINLVQIGVD